MDETFSPRLRVAAYERGDTNSLIPLNGVDVALFKVDSRSAPTTDRTANDLPVVFANLEVLITGELYQVRASFDGRQVETPVFIMCRDTLVNVVFEPALQLLCNDLDREHTLVFVDNEVPPSEQLYQNAPPGVGRYCQALVLRAPIADDVEVSLPPLPWTAAPFTLERVVLNGRDVTGSPFTILAGQFAEFHFCVSTANIGDFTESLNIDLRCPQSNQRGTAQINLEAEVIEPLCECIRDESETIEFVDAVPVGETETIVQLVYTNPLPCSVVLDNATVPAPWNLDSDPQLPESIPAGESVTFTVEFAPRVAGEYCDTVLFPIRPEDGGRECLLEVILKGIACENACPTLRKNLMDYASGDDIPKDTLSVREDKRVMFRRDPANPGVEASFLSPIVTGFCTLQANALACDDIELSITFEDATPGDLVDDEQYFSTNQRRFSIAPNEIRTLDITFTAPTKEEFDTEVIPLRGFGDTEDSTFSVFAVVSGGGCEWRIPVCAIVTPWPNFVPLPDLYAFGQRTPAQNNNRDFQVYYFLSEARSLDVRDSNSSVTDPPPDCGDLWVDVPNNDTPNSFTPQWPILNLRTNAIEECREISLGAPRFRHFYEITLDGVNSTDTFKDVCATSIPAFCEKINDPFTPLTSIELQTDDIGKIFAFEPKSPGLTGYALIYINSVDDGTLNASQASNISFYVIYPVYPDYCE